MSDPIVPSRSDAALDLTAIEDAYRRVGVVTSLDLEVDSQRLCVDLVWQSVPALLARVRQLEQERDTVRLELTVLGEETERYVRQAEALLVRLRTLPRYTRFTLDATWYNEDVVKWADIEVILENAAGR